MYTNFRIDTPIIKCFTCNIGRHHCQINQADKGKLGWIWIYGECRDLLIEDGFMDVLKLELSKKHEEKTEKITKQMMRNSLNKIKTEPKTNSTNKKTKCKACAKIIYRTSIGCNKCSDTWFHLKCAGFSSEKEARGHSKSYICKTCKINEKKTRKQYTDAVNYRLWLQKLVELEKDYSDIKPDSWFNDNHMAYLFENLQQFLEESSEENPNTLFIKPAVVHWINTADNK